MRRPHGAGFRAYVAVTSPRFVTSEIAKPHVHAARRPVSTHVTKRVNCPRAAGIRAYVALTSPRFVTSAIAKRHVHTWPGLWVSKIQRNE